METTVIRGKFWKKIKQSVSTGDLRNIANSDYGEDAEGHYHALIKIYNNNEMPAVLLWEPREVIELTHWSKYSKENKNSMIVVLFCSFLLLEALKNERNFDYLDGGNQNIILAIDCANNLGENWLELLNEYLKDLYRTINKPYLEEEIIYFSLGVSLASIILNDKITFLSWSKVTEINVINIEETGCFNKKNGILGYTFYDIRHKLWKYYINKYKKEYMDSPLKNIIF